MSPRRRVTVETVVAWAVTAATVAFVLWQLHPSLLLRDSTPTQGDLGPHLHEPAHLRDHLLPWLSGWSPEWFTGYPSLTFYFPLGALLVVVLDVLLPYNVALKLAAAAGPVTLPLAAYAFGRLTGRRRAGAACYAVLMLPLLLHQDLYQAGGTIGSAAVGEYGYGLSLSLGLVVVGLAVDGLRTGRRRALTSVLLAATVLLHVLPTVTVVLGVVVGAVLRPAWTRLRQAAAVLVTAGALAGFWLVPFVLRNGFTTGPDYPKAEPLSDWLLPGPMLPVVAVAVVGAVASIGSDTRGKDDDGVFLVVMAVLSGLLFALTPTGRVWNARFLPLWFLWVCLLAGYGLARMAEGLEAWRRKRARGRDPRIPVAARLALPVVVLVAALPLWDTRLGKGLMTASRADFTAFARQFVEGYEYSDLRTEYGELVETVRAIGREYGCGRAHWEYDDSRWTDVRGGLLHLLPYMTDGCIDSTEGLYQQAAATSLFVHYTNTRLSASPTPFFDEPPPFDVDAGGADLRLLGVRYFMASTVAAQRAADAASQLRLVAETKPYEGRVWRIYEVEGIELVEPLRFVPVVVPGLGRSRASWEAGALRWYDDVGTRDVFVATDGPDDWPRAGRVTSDLPRQPVPSTTTVSDVRIGDTVSFDVSEPGTPVLVKVSYFPNWRARGAHGPWRVAPNQMVVVPTSPTVTLSYGTTAMEWAGWSATLAGMGGLVLLARSGPLELPEPLSLPTVGAGETGGRTYRKRRR